MRCLAVEPVEVADLARIYGTPMILIDADRIERTIRSVANVCAVREVGVSYAAKALLCRSLARLIARAGIGIDVCSMGELQVVESAGFPVERITLHGAGKTDQELLAAAGGRVGRIVVDGLCELRRLAELAPAGARMELLFRINTGVDVDTHPHVTTVGAHSKFGLEPDEEEEAASIVRARPELRFAGLHAHAGSQIAGVETFAANAAALGAAAERFRRLGLASRVLVAGGGFAVAYGDGADGACDVGAAVGAMLEALGSERAALEIEPGRAIVAEAGTTIYRVLSVKRRPGHNVAVVDGGMTDNPRPALYGAVHRVVAVNARAGALRETRVFGRACESDFIASVQLPEDLARGDLLAVCTTGAYTYSMASNYNGFPKPALVAVRGGRHEPWS
ncbi:MAG TPA: diaminopimelate decarboxylase [Candidatus Acidoferrales bacterium]|nr:diaminopimelate decarboxylase [Candidatus Acidoferrales bacterium]